MQSQESFVSRQPPILWTETFDALNVSRWHQKSVSGQSNYELIDLEGKSCLKARSEDSASIILSKIGYDPVAYPWLSWQWRVDQPVESEDLYRKDASDAAARVYVYFGGRGLPWQRPSIDYVWSNALPAGTIINSAYADYSKIIVVEGGNEHLGQWRSVERNIKEDYRRVFGRDPRKVVAIGLMTDTDNTDGEALAYFDDLRVSRRALLGNVAGRD